MDTLFSDLKPLRNELGTLESRKIHTLTFDDDGWDGVGTRGVEYVGNGVAIFNKGLPAFVCSLLIVRV
jgi:hypothetical protein